MDGVRPVRLRVTEQRILPAAEGEVPDRHGNGHVDADHPDLRLPLEPTRGSAVVGEDRGAVAILRRVDESEPLVVGGHAHNGEHRSEDLVLVDIRIGGDVVDERGSEPESARLTVDLDTATVDHEGSPVTRGDVEVAGDLVAVLLGDERSHVAVAGTVADLQPSHPRGDLSDQFIGDRLDRNHDTDGHASLPRRTETGVHGRVGDEVEVCVGQHEHVVLGTTEGLHPLARRCRCLVDVLGDRSRTDKADGGDIRMVQQGVDRLLIAVHHVQHAIRKPGLREQLGHENRGRRVFLARLQHHRVSQRDRKGEEPQRHHRRKVERADDPDHAERLAGRVDVDACRHVLAVLPFRKVRRCSRELHHLEASGDFPESIGEHLAVLVREDGGQLLLASVEQLAEREHHTLALRPRRTRPGGESRLRRLHRHVHIRRRSQPHLLRHRPDRRVVHRSGASGLTDESGAIDKVIENAHGSHGRGHAFAFRAMSHPLRILSAWTQLRPSSQGSSSASPWEP